MSDRRCAFPALFMNSFSRILPGLDYNTYYNTSFLRESSDMATVLSSFQEQLDPLWKEDRVSTRRPEGF